MEEQQARSGWAGTGGWAVAKRTEQNAVSGAGAGAHVRHAARAVQKSVGKTTKDASDF